MNSSVGPDPSRRRLPLPHRDRKLPTGAQVAGASPAMELLSVSVIVKRRGPLHLEDLGGRQLTRAEFLERYAASPGAFNTLRRFAAEYDLTVDEDASSLARRTLVLSGTVEAMQRAFQVQLQQVEHSLGVEHQVYRICVGPITLPAEYAVLVDAVLGLDTRPQARSHLRRLREMPGQKVLRPGTAAAVAHTPPQVAQFYDFPTGVDGVGETIGIIELGGGFTPSDIQQYFQGLGLTPPSVVAVSVDGSQNAPTNPNSADSEVMLDIEVAGGVAHGAKIAVYFAPNTDQGFVDAITTAVHDTTNHPSVVSISWGGPESSWSQQALTALDDACQSAGALGVTITVAAGDSGSTDGVNDGAEHVDFPASSPHVLGCGGTEIFTSGATVTSEVVWNDTAQGGGATGGGVSTAFALPTWQQQANVPGATGGASGRGVPDVAGDAAPETGYQIEVDGQSEVVGGTSAVAPLWAGLVALLNQSLGRPLGFINPQLYALLGSAAFRDITQGNNGAYSAGPGWDACTGLGVPVGQRLLALLGV